MKDYILGIDLGTTNSLVGVVDGGFPILLADEDGQRLTPSAVFYSPSGEVQVGRAALRQRAIDSSRTLVEVKRGMGRKYTEMPPELVQPLQHLGTDPIQVSAEILKHLKQVAERALEQEVSRAVITVPAYFNDAQRHATKLAGEQAGLKVERILSEPTAAALAYGLDKLEENQKVAVYDLGGGTFDISILEMKNGVFQVLSTAGDTALGGSDFDEAILNWMLKEVNLQAGELSADQLARLRTAAEQAKKELSQQDRSKIVLPFFHEQRSFEWELEVSLLKQLIRPFLERTQKLALRAMSDAGVSPEALDHVILVGGSTRTPGVKEAVEQIFQQSPNLSQHPDEAIALGAVIQAGILEGSLRQVILLDVTPLSLGIETFGGLMNVIIPRNTTIPCKAGELFTNAVANQESILLRVLQGEREMARDNWELGSVAVPFESGPKGSARVGVEFSLDANGILTVLARDTKTGVDTILKIENSAVDVDDAKVEAMIAESVDFAFEDMSERRWTEVVAKSREMLEAVETALGYCEGHVEEKDLHEIRNASELVQDLAIGGVENLEQLKAANQALDEATQNLAVIMVELAMAKSLEDRLG